MQTGPSGAFAIPLSQIETDGEAGAPPEAMFAGATFRWQGPAWRLDGPPGLLRLSGAAGAAALQARAARRARQMLAPRLPLQAPPSGPDAEPAEPQDAFALTDGLHLYRGRWVRTGAAPVALFAEGLPPEAADLWVVQSARPPRPSPAPPAGLAPDTPVATPQGLWLAADLRPGDALAGPEGPAEVAGLAEATFGAARLALWPALRPVRIRSGALGPGRPAADLTVGPGTRIALAGQPARALHGADAVLVAAQDLVGRPGIARLGPRRAQRLVAPICERPRLLRAADLWCESGPEEGEPPLRRLSAGEAAILLAGPGLGAPA